MAPLPTKYPELYWIEGNALDAPSDYGLLPDQEEGIIEYVRGLISCGNGRNSQAPIWRVGNTPSYPVHISFRYSGVLAGEGIAVGDSLQGNFQRAVKRAFRLGARAKGTLENLANENIFVVGHFVKAEVYEPLSEEATVQNVANKRADDFSVEITLFFAPHVIADRNLASTTTHVEPGVHGIGLQMGRRLSLFSNSKWIIHNYRSKKMLERLGESIGLGPSVANHKDSLLLRFNTRHLVQRDSTQHCEAFYRGDRTIPLHEISISNVKKAVQQMGSWLLNNLRGDGRLEYKYMPSRGSYSSSNNMIRQWMSTQALAELFFHTGEDRYAESYHRNVNYNLKQHYFENRDHAYILYNNKAKLGAAACAMMALLRNPKSKEYDVQIKRLRNLLYFLSEPDGSFRTFFIPKGRNDNQSFYSGEALLALALDAGESWDSQICDRFCRAIDFYMPYYRSTQRYAPFIPWHTMAYWHAYNATTDARYLEAIFELNDWLICLQDLKSNSYPDIVGRFYLPDFSNNGPPHVSSTAVYLEGLVYAYVLAKDSANTDRSDAYLSAIQFGLRSLLQLQYRPENSFYLKNKRRVLGGLRTTTTDNQLRCDNTQHAVMACIAVLKNLGDEELNKTCLRATSFRRKCLSRFVATRQELQSRTVAAAPDDRTTILLGGDIQLGRFTETWATRKGVDHGLRGIQVHLQKADVLISNLECVVAKGGDKIRKQGEKVWHLRASPHMLGVFPNDLLNVVSVANNHSMDYGPAALLEMIETHLPATDILFSGAGRSCEQAAKPAIFELNGTKYAFFSGTIIEREFGATPMSAGYHWLDASNLKSFSLGIDDMLEQLTEQVDFRILAIHWGKNHDDTVLLNHRLMAHRAVDAGLDLIIGHHAHINRGIEIYKGTPIFYDLGNFLVDFKFQGWDDKSVLVKLTMRSSRIESIEIIPVNLHDKAVNIAVGSEARLILSRIQSLSSPFGTHIHYIKETGYVHLS